MPLADHLVGRAEELGSLDRVLAELDGGHAVAVEIGGEPGIGKTRLLKELAARAEARGHLVLLGSAAELERNLPFSVFVDALDEYVEGLDAKWLATLDDGVQAELAHVLPSLSTLAGDHALALQHERYRSHRAMRELLGRLAARKPLVLGLDDLHWADAASVELVGALLRRPPAAAVLIALAHRPRRCPERLIAAFERAHRAAALTRIELAALTPAEARELLGETVDAADAAVLFQESGGNPFYLEQLARSLSRAGATTPVPEITLSGIGIPSAVAAALSAELTQLSDSARRVLEGAAVAGDPFELGLAAATAATAEAAAMDAVDELLESISSAPPTCPGASASGTRLSAARSTRPQPAGGDWLPTSAAPRHSSRAVPRPVHAPTTSSARRARATSAPSPSCARPARQPLGWRRTARHAGSPARSGCCPQRRRRTSASSSCSPAPAR